MIPCYSLSYQRKFSTDVLLLVIWLLFYLLIKCGIGLHATNHLFVDISFLKIKEVTNYSDLESLLASNCLALANCVWLPRSPLQVGSLLELMMSSSCWTFPSGKMIQEGEGLSFEISIYLGIFYISPWLKIIYLYL